MSWLSCMYKYAVYKAQRAARLPEHRVSQRDNTCNKYAMHVCCLKGDLSETCFAQLRQVLPICRALFMCDWGLQVCIIQTLSKGLECFCVCTLYHIKATEDYCLDSHDSLLRLCVPSFVK